MYSENSTFTLAYWWSLNQPEDDAQKISFTRLFKSLSFARMSLQFLGAIVGLCPWVIESGLLPSIMAVALSFAPKKMDGQSISRLVKPDGQPSSAYLMTSYSIPLQAELHKARLDALDGGDWASIPFRVVHGYPLVLWVQKKAKVHLGFETPFEDWTSDGEYFHEGYTWESGGKKLQPFSFRLTGVSFAA